MESRLKFFQNDEKNPLDYKFYKTRIVNLTEEYNFILLSISNIFFRKSFIKSKLFEENVLSGEDERFINNFLLIKPITGVIKDSIYYCRRKEDLSLNTQNKAKNINIYIETLYNVEYFLINLSKYLYNKILPFLQYLIAYNLLLRIKASKIKKFWDKHKFKQYCEIIEKLLKQIEDKYILEQKEFSNNYKLFALSKKYKKDLRYELKFENNSFFYLENTIIDFETEKNIIIWRILDINDNILHLEGVDNFWLPKGNYFYFCKVDNQTFYPKNYYNCANYDFVTMYGLIEKGRIVVFDIPLGIINSVKILKFYISYTNYITEIFPSLGMFSHIPTIPNGYYISKNKIIKYIDKRLTLFKYDKTLSDEFENLYRSELHRQKKDHIIKIRETYFNKINVSKKYEIWLISDRRDRAGDNGEYFFRYIKSKNFKGIKAYFIIEKNSSDYKRLKKFEDVLDIDSDIYISIFLQGDKIITSMPNNWVTNPFNMDQIYIRDLLHFSIVYLGHGIIKDDLSKELNRFMKNYDLFVISSKKEYKSFFDYQYGYQPKNIILTGMPRYDNLENMKSNINKKKTIVILPTWRSNIEGTRESITYKSIHSDTFIYTKFFKFYNNLINDRKLHLIMKKNNYKGTFCLHPSFSSQYIDFTQNQFFSIIEKCNYQKLILESSLLITDYSSIFFDFAYLRKPIIYAHFDYKEYRIYHYKEGYFDYSHGFGPVCKDIKCIINEVTYEIENDCFVQKNYLRNINKFFIFSDNQSSERVYNEIMKRKICKNKNPEFLFNFIMICIISIIYYKLKYINFYKYNITIRK